MAIVKWNRCVYCGADFTGVGFDRHLACFACAKVARVRDLFGVGEAADCWIALLYPEVLEQEERQAAYVRELQEAMRENLQGTTP